MRSGLARCCWCALIAFVAGCDPLTFGESRQLAIGDGGIVMVDDALVDVDDAPPPADAPVEGAADAPTEGPPPDAPMEGGPDAALPDAAVPDAAVPDAAMPDAALPDAGVPDDGGVVDGSLTDALAPDAPDRPGGSVSGAHEGRIQSFYACSTGDGASALPLLLAILVLRRRPIRGSGVT